MSDFVRLVRYAVGLTLVVAGGVAAGPYVSSLAAAYGRTRGVAPPPETAAWVQQAASAAPQPGGFGPAPARPETREPPAAWDEALPSHVPPAEPIAAPLPPVVLRSDYRPPPPPATLPPIAASRA